MGISTKLQESRRLGEVHVSILRLILKDIDEVTRVPAVSSGVNQSSAVNPEGGHLQIVEMVYLRTIINIYLKS
jgi:hypothetical protein